MPLEELPEELLVELLPADLRTVVWPLLLELLEEELPVELLRLVTWLLLELLEELLPVELRLVVWLLAYELPEEVLLRLAELDEADDEELRLAEEPELVAVLPLDLLVDWPDADAEDFRVEEELPDTEAVLLLLEELLPEEADEVVLEDEEELPAALLLVCPPMSAERANIAAISTAVTILFAMFFISDEF